MESLPIDVSRGCTSERGEDDIRVVGVIAGLLEDACHHVVERVNDSRFATACATVYDD